MPRRSRSGPALSAAAGGPAGAASADGASADVVVGTHRLSRFYLRFHVSLLILWSFACGLLVNKALLLAGVDSMLIRYPTGLLIGYGAFFVGVRLWLAYVGASPLWSSRDGKARSDSGTSIDLSDLPAAGSGSGSGSGSGWIPRMRPGGGDFGGGGASASFADTPRIVPNVASAPTGTPAFAASSGGSTGGAGSMGRSGVDLDLDLGDGDGWLVVLLLALVAALLCSVFGAVLYLVWSAPTMLADVAFSAMLAGGLVRSSRRWRDACWQTRLLRATWIPFTLVLVLSLLTAGLAMHVFPDARTLGDVVHMGLSSIG